MRLTPKQKPNGIYYLDVMVPAETGGMKRQRVGLDTRDPSDAAEQTRQWLLGTHPKHPSQGGTVAPKQRAADRDPSVTQKAPKATGVTMKDLLSRCEMDPEVWLKSKAQSTIRSNCKLLIERIGDEPIVTITRKRLQQLVDDMRDEGYKPASIKRKLDMVSKALRMAAEVYEHPDGTPWLAAKPPMPKITVSNAKDRWLQPDEELMVFAALDARVSAEPARQWVRFRLFVRVLLDTAFRRSEALGLGQHSVVMGRIEQGGELVDWPFLSLGVGTTKNGKAHMVPCSPIVAELIPQLNAQAINGLWFPLDSTAWYMWSNIREDVKAMGGNIDDVGLHTLRHTCLTKLALGGMELQRLSMWANHSDVSVTASRYSHLSPTALAGGISILGATGGKSANGYADPEPSVIRNYSGDIGNRANSGTMQLH